MAYVNKLDLEKIPVSYEFDYDNQKFIEIYDYTEPLSWGKSSFKISINDIVSRNLTLKQHSDLLIQLKDSDGNDILTKISPISSIDGDALAYFWLKYNLQPRTPNTIINGTAYLTIVGQLENVNNIGKDSWSNTPNFRITKEIQINTDLPNISPIVFQSQSLIQSTLNVSESIRLDKNSNYYNRSYLIVSFSDIYGIICNGLHLSPNV